MPCDNYSNTVNQEYVDVVNAIELIINSEDWNGLIVCGDFNTSFSRNNAQSACLNDFMNRNRLISSWDNPHANIDFTYCNHSLNHLSVIDHFIVSLHNAVSLSMSSFGCQPIISVNPSIHTSKRCNWNKYLSCTDCDHIDAIDNTCDTVVKYCIDSGLTSIPSSRLNVREVPDWNDEIRQAKDQSLFWHWIWLESGRPNTGHVYAIMKRTRHQYHYSIRRCKLNTQEIQRTKLAESFLDPTMFWSELNKISSVGKQISDTVGNASGSKKIAQLFHDKYKALSNSVGLSTSEDELRLLRETLSVKLLRSANTSSLDLVTPDLIKRCISKLKSGKGDGNESFTSDHLINSCNRLHSVLALLFRSIIYHGHYPDNLLKSTIISIPKDAKASLSNVDNYRGISLSNSINKVFDYVIIELYQNTLVSSDMQFAYKSQHSTALCSVVYLETLQYYRQNGSQVDSCLLDASKAFDRIHYGKLFNILLSRKLPAFIIRVLFDSYSRQQSRAMWNSCYTEYFYMSNGVK